MSKHVIEFRNGLFFKNLDADHSAPLKEALVFDSKAAAEKFMDANQWIYLNGGMALALEKAAKAGVVERTYTAQTLATMPTLCTGQCCSLKVETATTRVWLCRVAGGVTIEEYNGRRWEITGGGCTKRNFVARVGGLSR